jgi:hypothetical protein
MRSNQGRFLTSLLSFIVLLHFPALAQSQNINARISGKGGSGKCTFEVRVDGVAEVGIRGNQGRLRTISGSPAQWVRLDCNQALPRNPNNFRFKGIDGRGKQSLVQSPGSNNGIAVVRIEDNRNGMEGYTGDIMWNGGSDNGGGNWNGGDWNNWGGGDWNNGNNNWNGGNPKVVSNCQNAIRNKLVRQYGGNLTFKGRVDTQQAGSFIMVQGLANYRDGSGQTGDIQYNCTMHPNGNVADSKYKRVGNFAPPPQPR